MRRSTIAALALLPVIVITSAYRLTRTTTPTVSSTTTPPAVRTVPPPVGSNTSAAPHETTPTTPSPAHEVAVETPTAAALRFLDLDEELFPIVTPERARALTESIASSRNREHLAAQAEDQQRQMLAKGDLAGLTLRIAPIVTRTRDCTADACTVDVYFLRLWSFPARGALDDYATAEIHVARENDEWRLDSSSLIDGPYPAGRYSARPNATFNAASFEDTLRGFTDNEVTK